MTQPSTDAASARGAVWMCYGGMMCLAIAVNLPPVYLTTFGRTFGGAAGLSDEQLGRIPAFVFASLTLGILISGPLADRWGGKVFAMLGLALACAGLALMGAARTYRALLVAACLMGLGSGILDMVLSPIVCALEPDRRASAMNWLHSFYCMGAVGTVLIGSCALYLNVSWRAVSFAIIAFPAFVFAGFARTRIPALAGEDHDREPVSALLKHPYFLAALGAIALGGATEQGMSQWLPAFAERVQGCPRTTGGMVLAGFLVAMVIGRVLAAVIGRHIRPIRLMVVCCGLSALLFMVGCFWPDPRVALSACMGVGLTSSCLWPTMLGVTADRFPRGGGSMFALLAACGNAGCFVMPWIVGGMAERTGRLDWGLATAALCPIIMAAVLLWLGAQSTRAALTTRPAPSASDSPAR